MISSQSPDVSPIAHLLVSWIVAAKTTDNERDRQLVTWAGVLPDVDGLGIIVDGANHLLHRPQTDYYHDLHHFWTHGLPAAIVIPVLLACFARRKQSLGLWPFKTKNIPSALASLVRENGRIFLLAFLVFHLHLLCDIVGSRGPDLSDRWPIIYLAPIKNKLWIDWHGQWQLDGWQNKTIFIWWFFWSLKIAVDKGFSVVGLFSRKADRVFVSILREWTQQLGYGGAIPPRTET